MHFLTSDARALNWMKIWKPNVRIITHYFYALGQSPFQTDATGLYSGLLSQLLDEDENLTTRLLNRFPSSSRKDCLEHWSAPDLERLLKFALHSRQSDIPLCIFIDGLDEYSGVGGHDGLLESLDFIRRYPGVKLCVSSRPDRSFLDKLRGPSGLKLQELTRPDMEGHVEIELGKFLRNGKISAQVKADITCLLLERAQGVFLWLHVVLESVKEGIRNGDGWDI